MKGTSSTRVLLVDDHPIVREGVALFLGNRPGFMVCGQVGTTREALDAARTLPLDLVILDLCLRGGPGAASGPESTSQEEGLRLLQELRRLRPRVPVLILSMHSEPWIIRQALQIGAAGFVRKEDAAEHLATAIEQVLRGETYLPPGLAKAILGDGLPAAPPPSADAAPTSEEARFLTLTAREKEILALLFEGIKIREIARVLGISRRTVDAHQANLKQKLGISSNRELLLHAPRLRRFLQEV